MLSLQQKQVISKCSGVKPVSLGYISTEIIPRITVKSVKNVKIGDTPALTLPSPDAELPT